MDWIKRKIIFFINKEEYTPLTKEEKIENFKSIKVKSDRRLKLYGKIFKKIINEINISLNNFTLQKSHKKLKKYKWSFFKRFINIQFKIKL